MNVSADNALYHNAGWDDVLSSISPYTRGRTSASG